MLFTADGLEQATRLEVAAQPRGAVPRRRRARTVHDLGCGIGADAMAFAGLDLAGQGRRRRRGHRGDRRHQPAALARRARQGRPGRGSRRLPDPLRPRVGVWLDPARRIARASDARGRTKRVFRLDEISPTWASVQGIAPRRAGHRGQAVARRSRTPRVPLGTEAQWTSYAGEVLECAVWWGPLAQRAGRSAMVLRAGRLADRGRRHRGRRLRAGADGRWRSPAVGPWLYEPDRAVIRAGLTGALTAATGGRRARRAGVGYVAADRCVDVPWARRYSVTRRCR